MDILSILKEVVGWCIELVLRATEPWSMKGLAEWTSLQKVCKGSPLHSNPASWAQLQERSNNFAHPWILTKALMSKGCGDQFFLDLDCKAGSDNIWSTSSIWAKDLFKASQLNRQNIWYSVKKTLLVPIQTFYTNLFSSKRLPQEQLREAAIIRNSVSSLSIQ